MNDFDIAELSRRIKKEVIDPFREELSRRIKKEVIDPFLKERGIDPDGVEFRWKEEEPLD